MEPRYTLILMAAWASLSSVSAVSAPEDSPTAQAVKLANQGNVDRAIQVLRDHLGKNAKDLDARMMLGRILDFDGQPDEAVTVWEAGLTDADSDLPLLMSIGEIRQRQGNDGPTVTYRRGIVGAMPSKNAAEEERFKRLRLEQAARAYERARKFRFGDPEAAKALASVYSAQNKHERAAEVWKSLIAHEPKNGEYRLGLALATQKAGRSDEAVRHLKQAIDLNPRLAEAHGALAEIQEKMGQIAAAAQCRKQADFYKRLPSFCTLGYSEENVKMLDGLDHEDLVRKLAEDPSPRASEFLAIVCWSHPHNRLETEAFESLEARGAGTTPLLRALLDSAGSTCTIKSTARILARRKTEGLFDYLVKMLPGDVRGFAMDMDIAGSLDDLGDPRAVGPLVQMLNPGDAQAAQENGPLVDRNSARARAALALGAFDTPEARRALDDGTKDPRLSAYCLAALYRLTKDRRHLATLEKSVTSDEGYPTYLLGNYLLKKVDTDQARDLARKWEQERDAQAAADEARTKQKADTIPKKDPR